MSPAIKGGRVGGVRNPKGEALDVASITDIRPALMPSQGRGKKPRHYRNVEEVELNSGTVVYRCKHDDCQEIAFKSASAAAMHRGAVHPGQSPRAADVRRDVKKALAEPAAVEVAEPAPVVNRVRRPPGRPPADQTLAEDGFLDLAAPSIGRSVTEFIDQLIASRERAITRANDAQAQNKRLIEQAARIKHHLVGLFNELREYE